MATRVRKNDPLIRASIEEVEKIVMYETDDDGYFSNREMKKEDLLAIAQDLRGVTITNGGDVSYWVANYPSRRQWTWRSAPLVKLKLRVAAMIEHDAISKDTSQANPDTDKPVRCNSI